MNGDWTSLVDALVAIWWVSIVPLLVALVVRRVRRIRAAKEQREREALDAWCEALKERYAPYTFTAKADHFDVERFSRNTQKVSK